MNKNNALAATAKARGSQPCLTIRITWEIFQILIPGLQLQKFYFNWAGMGARHQSSVVFPSDSNVQQRYFTVLQLYPLPQNQMHKSLRVK